MEQIFIRILYMSITAGYCALIVMVLRLIMHRLPKIYSYGLWLVVFLRFVCPVFPESSYSVVRFEPGEIWQSISYDIKTSEEGNEDAKREKTVFKETGLDSGDKESVIDGNFQITDLEGNVQGGNLLMGHNENAGKQRQPEGTYQQGIKQTAWADVAGVIWLAGAMALAFYSIRSAFRLKKQLAGAKCQKNNIYVADNLRTPFVLGVIKPCIYLPSDLERSEREVVLVHEKIHVKRKDYLIKSVAFFITSLHWFNPLAWISYYLMCRDMEMSCDEIVIEKMGQGIKKEYSASLLSLASGRRMDSIRMTAFGEGNVKKRIVRVLNYKKTSMKGVILGSTILVAAMAGMLFNSVKVSAKQNTVWEFLSKRERVQTISSATNPSEQSQKFMEEAEELFGGEEEYREPVLHLYVPDFFIENDYVDLELMPEEEYSYLAQQALYELYEMTGTKIEECYYYYTGLGDFSFGLTPEDLEHSRVFYTRSFGSGDREEFVSIPSVYLANARSVWYSPVYQYKLPENFADMNHEERAVWFVTNSPLYNGQEVTGCRQPYPSVQSTWRIDMADGTAYEIDLDNKTDSFGNLTGPYPDGDIGH